MDGDDYDVCSSHLRIIRKSLLSFPSPISLFPTPTFPFPSFPPFLNSMATAPKAAPPAAGTHVIARVHPSATAIVRHLTPFQSLQKYKLVFLGDQSVGKTRWASIRPSQITTALR
jgi:hypothetical protein